MKSHFIICSFSEVATVFCAAGISHAVAIYSPGSVAPVLPSCATLKLVFNDVASPQDGMIAPDRWHIQQLLDFGRSWDEKRPFGISCYAGVSRSSAAAYILACDRHATGEQEIAVDLRQQAPFVTPNSLMVALADDMLKRKGKMIEAIQRIGRGEDVHTGTAYTLTTRKITS